MVLYLMVRADLSVSRLSLAEVGVGCSAPFFLGRNDCSLLKPHSVQNRKFDHKTRKAVNFVIIKFVFIGRETGLRVYRRLSFFI